MFVLLNRIIVHKAHYPKIVGVVVAKLPGNQDPAIACTNN